MQQCCSLLPSCVPGDTLIEIVCCMPHIFCFKGCSLLRRVSDTVPPCAIHRRRCRLLCIRRFAILSSLLLQLEEFTQWLQQQIEAQDKKEPTEEPAFIAMDVVTKWEGVQKALRKTDSKRKPKPPKPAANETASANETAAAEGAAEGTAEGAEGAGADAGGEAGAGAEESAGEQEGGDSSSSSTAAEDEELPAHEEL